METTKEKEQKNLKIHIHHLHQEYYLKLYLRQNVEASREEIYSIIVYRHPNRIEFPSKNNRRGEQQDKNTGNPKSKKALFHTS